MKLQYSYYDGSEYFRRKNLPAGRGGGDVKERIEMLMCGKTLRTELDEQIVYNQLDQDESAIWSLMVASGYLKVKDVDVQEDAVLQMWKP